MAVSAERAESQLARVLIALHPEDVARRLDTGNVDEAVSFLAAHPAAQGAAVLRSTTPDRAAKILVRAPVEVVRRWVAEMNPNRVAAIIAQLDADDRDSLLKALDPSQAEELRRLMEYPADAAGALMDPRVLTFRPDSPVRDVVKRLRTLQQRRVQDLFLVDDDAKLVGSVALQDVVLAKPDEKLAALARPSTPLVRALDPRDDVLEEFGRHRAMSLPVVDFEGHVIGVLRQEQIVAAAQQEATADLARMVGASADERALSSPWLSVRKRLPWLQVNLLTAFLAASVVGLFESTIAQFTALAVLLPVVAGQSGNTGSQALAVTMRGLALREVRARQWLAVAWKEVRAGAMNGVAVALTTSLAVFAWSSSIGLAFVIAISMVISMILAGLSGACIPMILTSLRQDPAQSSSIILTTVTDVAGFFSFLGIATLLSSMI